MTVSHLPPPPDDDGVDLGPADLDAERTVLGCLLSGDRGALDDVTSTITGGDYADPRHEAIHDAAVHLYARGEPVDVIAVTDRLRRTKDIRRAGGAAYLHELRSAVVVTAGAGYYADIVRDLAQRRRVAQQARSLLAKALTPGDAPMGDILERHRLDLDTVVQAVPGVEQDDHDLGETVEDFLRGEDDPYDWLIPNMLERTDRLILTAGEGHGKSTLLRQIAVQAASGIHPVTGEQITPVKVLLLDLENSRRQTRRKLRPLCIAAGRQLDPANLVIHVRIQGINLNDSADIAWLDRLIVKHAPDLLVTGPIYKMADGDPNDERESKPVVYALDSLRARHNLTIVLEAHTKKAEGADGKKRAKDPVGWSGWRRWPEFGLHLSEDGALTHWRGARDERTWPHQLNRGGKWPFTPEITIKDRYLSLIKQCIQQHGRIPSEREMSTMTNIPRTTLQRLLKEHAAELNTLQYWTQAAGENQP